MKSQLYILIILSALVTSCQKVIDVDLNAASPEYVIEANLYEGSNPFRVHVALTTDFYGKDVQKQVDGATVTLIDPAGASINVPATGGGWYQLNSYTATSGKTYQLKVVVNQKEFTASSTMPTIVAIDSISKEWNEANGFREEGYDLAAWFKDPEGERNYYRIIRTENDTLRTRPEDLYLLEDKFNEGKPVKADFFERYQKGEKLDVELLTMDAPVYDFYTSLQGILNNQNGPAPANPLSNIKGGALGYFGAFTRSKKTIILPL